MFGWGLSCDCRLPLADLTPTSHFILGNKLNILYNTLSRRRCFLCPRKHSIRLGINGALFCAALGTASAPASSRIYASTPHWAASVAASAAWVALEA